MLKNCTTYILGFILSTIFYPAFAENNLSQKVNSHLDEARYEFIRDRDPKDAARELRASAMILKNESKFPDSIEQKNQLDKSSSELEHVARKLETGNVVTAKEFNDAVDCARIALKEKTR